MIGIDSLQENQKNNTPIQELFKRFGHLLPDVEEEFIEKEKSQIIDAYNIGKREYNIYSNGKSYYNKTYHWQPLPEKPNK